MTNAKTPSPKKKRCRIRNRPRNKANRLAAAAAEAAAANTIPSKGQSQPETRTILDLHNSNHSPIVKQPQKPVVNMKAETASTEAGAATAAIEKTREQIMAEREAKKLAKQAKKNKSEANVPTETSKVHPPVIDATSEVTPAANVKNVVASNSLSAKEEISEKSREQIKAEREAKKLAKQNAKAAKITSNNTTVDADVSAIGQGMANLKLQQISNAKTSTGADIVASSSQGTAEDEEKVRNYHTRMPFLGRLKS